MNIFETAPEFIEWDNRQARKVNQVTAESTYNRLSAQLPDWFVKDNTVLDLGSCLGAAGHMALTNGAKHYTGIEFQQKYVDDSRKIFEKYWPTDKFNIVQANLIEFLDDCIANNIKFDCVIASGVLYTFIDIVRVLEKIAAVSAKSVLIDTMYVGEPKSASHGLIIVRDNMRMVYAHGPKTFTGIGSTCSLRALDIVLKTCGFYRTEDPIIPPVTVGSHDGYSDILDQQTGLKSPARLAARFFKKSEMTRTLLDIVLEDNEANAEDFYQDPKVVVPASSKIWTFDDSVASRFQQEAQNHIPDYDRVVKLCLDLAKDNLPKDSAIIDVGSALGYTVDKFVQQGFSNVWGLDNSEAMVAKSLHKERIILSDQFPTDKLYKMVMMNWTLHFVLDKYNYLKSIFNSLEDDGYLILTDKTSQSAEVKKKYYDFKRENGVSQAYIEEKEKKLAGYMYTVPASWYNANLSDIGFTSVEVINAKLGFVTYLCKK